MIGLTTERLHFRQWQTTDYPLFSNFYTQKENAQFVGGIKGPEDSWRLMATYIGHYILKGYSYLAVEEKSTERLIGTIGLWNSDPWPEKELGYWLLPEAQGKGFGIEAGIAVRDYALQTLHFDSLVSYIDPANEASVQLAMRLGAQYDKTIDLLDFGPHAIYRYK